MQPEAKGRTIGGAICAAVVAAVLTACSSSGTAPATLSDTQISTDLASGAGIAAATQAGASAEVMNPMENVMAIVGGNRRTSAQSVCTTGSFTGSLTFPASDPRDTIAISRTWGFFAAGVCENSYVAGTTDSVVFTTAVTSELNGARGFWNKIGRASG